MKNNVYNQYIKQILDFTMSVMGIVIFLPILTIVYFLVLNKLGSPVIFKQSRPGLNGKLFHIYKFRTMTNEKNVQGYLLPPEKRAIPLGRTLRSTSIDELPELWNVLKGEMSLVGPRPLRVEYLPLYTKEQFKRHMIKPGITGWAQIKGRNSITWEEKFKLDVWYVQNQSFLLDLKILFLTIIKIFKREGINQSEKQTMKPFKGVKLNG